MIDSIHLIASCWLKGRCIAALLLLLSIFANSTYAQSVTLEPGTWHLLSLPGNSVQTIDQMFADEFEGQPAASSWAIVIFNAQTQRYRMLDGDEPVPAGQGFWMKHIRPNTVTVDIPDTLPAPATSTSSACTSARGCFSLPLPTAAKANWSLVGLPFSRPVAVADLRIKTSTGTCSNGCSPADAATQGMTGGQLHAYDVDSGAYVAASTGDSLQPGVGYWFPSLISESMGPATLLVPRPQDVNTANIFVKAAQLGRGMNLGNALEAPSEGDWGISLEAYYFDRIADAGFDSVRVPIRWSAHADQNAPYLIDPLFLARIDWVLEQSMRRGLAIVLNVHHYEALMASPASQRERYLAIWGQIARRYSTQPDSVFFELLNEPSEQFNDQPQTWNALVAEAVDVVRQSNPDRALIIGPVDWNGISRLPDLQLPDDDQLIATVHFYSPFSFTHQGATWVDPVPPVGTRFDPAQLGIGGAFHDWSWDTTWEPVANGAEIRFQRQYAGFQLRKLVAGQLRELSVSIIGPVQLSVDCAVGNAKVNVGQINQSSVEPLEHIIDLSGCPANTETLRLQNLALSAQPFTIGQGEVCTTKRCYPVFERAGEALVTELQIAADWGTSNNKPVFIGEFGAYGAGDMASRAAWTMAVQDAIVQQGMTSAYWEFGAGFGAFNISEDRWYDPLLQALQGH